MLTSPINKFIKPWQRDWNCLPFMQPLTVNLSVNVKQEWEEFQWSSRKMCYLFHTASRSSYFNNCVSCRHICGAIKNLARIYHRRVDRNAHKIRQHKFTARCSMLRSQDKSFRGSYGIHSMLSWCSYTNREIST